MPGSYSRKTADTAWTCSAPNSSASTANATPRRHQILVRRATPAAHRRHQGTTGPRRAAHQEGGRGPGAGTGRGSGGVKGGLVQTRRPRVIDSWPRGWVRFSEDERATSLDSRQRREAYNKPIVLGGGPLMKSFVLNIKNLAPPDPSGQMNLA